MATTIKYVALLRKYEALKPCAEFAADLSELTKLIEIYEELAAVPDLARRFEPLLRRIVQIMRDVAEMPPAYDKNSDVEVVVDVFRFILLNGSCPDMNLHSNDIPLIEFAHTVAAEVMDKMREVFPMAPNALTDAPIKAAAERFKPKIYKKYNYCTECMNTPGPTCLSCHEYYIYDKCSQCNYYVFIYKDQSQEKVVEKSGLKYVQHNSLIFNKLKCVKVCKCMNINIVCDNNDNIALLTDTQVLDTTIYYEIDKVIGAHSKHASTVSLVDKFTLHYDMMRQYERHMLTRAGEYQTPPNRMPQWRALCNPAKIAELPDSQDIAAEKNEARRFAKILPLTRENLFEALAERLEPYFYICAQVREMLDSCRALAKTELRAAAVAKTEPGAAELAKVRQSIERMRILIMDANGEFDWALIGRIVRNPPVTTLFDTNNVVDKILTTPKLLREILEIELLCDSTGVPAY